MSPGIPLGRAGHLETVPVRLPPDLESHFVLDTGIGINLLSRKLVGTTGASRTSEVARGRRMSGQEIESPLLRLPQLDLGGRRWRDLPVAEIDMAGFHPMLRDLGGFLSLGPFEKLPFTIDHEHASLQLHPDGVNPFREGPGYEEVPLVPHREAGSLSVLARLRLPDGRVATVEVDSGSDALILHERYMPALGIRPGTPGVRTVEGKDETGHPYVRHFATARGTFALDGTRAIHQIDPPVMFQAIIYDGLIGADFLGRFNVTVDLPRSRLGFAPLRSR
jgi:hypothetical protein